MAEELFKDVGGARSGLAQLQENKVIRLIVFVIGALPQLIKLYAMKGILGTQVCVSLFLGSFLIIEAVMMWLNTYRNTTQGLGGQVTELNDSIRTLPVSILCSSYASISLILTVTWRISVVSLTLCLFLVLMGALFLPVYNKSFRLYGNLGATPYVMFSIILYCFLCVIIAFVWTAAFLSMDFSNTEVSRIVPWSLLQWIINGTFISALFATSPAATAHPRERPFSLGRFGHFAFILLQILAAILTYSLRYNPAGTYKPGWTNQLG